MTPVQKAMLAVSRLTPRIGSGSNFLLAVAAAITFSTTFLAPDSAEARADFRGRSYFSWGQSGDGYGRCYQYASNGTVLNNGRPVQNSLCERTQPSYFDWGTGGDGNTRCYQYSPQGYALNQGQPVPNHYCD